MHINCNQCGTTVQQKKPNHRFCSDRCRKRWHRQSKGKPALPDFTKFKSVTKQITQRPAPAPAPAPVVAQMQPAPVIHLPSTIEELMELRHEIQTKKPLPIGAGIGGVLGYNMADSFGWKIFFAAGMAYGGNWIQKNISNDSQILAAIDEKLKYISMPQQNISIPQQNISIPSVPASAITDKARALGIVSAKEYKEMKIPTIGFTGKYLYLMGDPAPGFYTLITGAPGQGKSTFSIQFAEYLETNHGKVLYMAAEQPGFNKPLQQLLKRYDISFETHTDPPSNIDLLSQHITVKDYKFIFFDSVNHMHISASDLKKLKDLHPDKSFICVMQSTKTGEFKGSQKYLHDCDIRLDLKSPKVFQTKSRYAPPSDMILFADMDK